MKGYFQGHYQPARGIVTQIEKMIRSIQPLQPILRIRQPQTLLKVVLRCPMFGKAGAVVSHLNTQDAVELFRGDLKQTR